MKKFLKLFLISFLCIGIIGCSGGNDKSKLSDKELYEYLQKEGFTFKTNSTDSTLAYFMIGEKVMLSQVETYTNKKLVVKTVTFRNTDLNSKYYYIYVNEDFLLKYKYDEDNATNEGKAQQKAFNEWLEEEGIKQEQVTKLIEYYKTIADKK